VLQVFTVDSESTTEVDDGLSVEVLPDGRQRVWVHVSDPSRWVAPNGMLDLEARARSKTLYLPTGLPALAPRGRCCMTGLLKASWNVLSVGFPSIFAGMRAS
jgi:exoribonuclease R